MSIPHLSAPEMTPRQSTAAHWFAHAGWVECLRIAAAFAFSLDWQDDELGRTLLLLGTDSPAEMTMHIRWAQLDSSRLEATTGLILRWMIERAAYWRGGDMDWQTWCDATGQADGS